MTHEQLEAMTSADFFLQVRESANSRHAAALILSALHFRGVLSFNSGQVDRVNNWKGVNADDVVIDFDKLTKIVNDESILSCRGVGPKGFLILRMTLGIRGKVKEPRRLIARCECCGQRLPGHMRK